MALKGLLELFKPFVIYIYIYCDTKWSPNDFYWVQNQTKVLRRSKECSQHRQRTMSWRLKCSWMPGLFQQVPDAQKKIMWPWCASDVNKEDTKPRCVRWSSGIVSGKTPHIEMQYADESRTDMMYGKPQRKRVIKKKMHSRWPTYKTRSRWKITRTRNGEPDRRATTVLELVHTDVQM